MGQSEEYFRGKIIPNLDFKQQKWKIMLHLLNKTVKAKKIKRVKSNNFHVILVANLK